MVSASTPCLQMTHAIVTAACLPKCPLAFCEIPNRNGRAGLCPPNAQILQAPTSFQTTYFGPDVVPYLPDSHLGQCPPAFGSTFYLQVAPGHPNRSLSPICAWKQKLLCGGIFKDTHETLQKRLHVYMYVYISNSLTHTTAHMGPKNET